MSSIMPAEQVNFSFFSFSRQNQWELKLIRVFTDWEITVALLNKENTVALPDKNNPVASPSKLRISTSVIPIYIYMTIYTCYRINFWLFSIRYFPTTINFGSVMVSSGGNHGPH